jgi:Uma2 family endonuclease
MEPERVREDQFYALGEDVGAEYLDGRLVPALSSDRHEDLFRFLITLFSAFLDVRGGGVVRGSRYPMRLDAKWSPEPDLFVVRDERKHLLQPQRLEGPADLVIEIASEGDPRFELREKIPRYEQAEIPEIWPFNRFERSVLVEVKTPEGYETRTLASGRLESRILPGFWIQVEWLWQEDLPSTYSCLQKILG